LQEANTKKSGCSSLPRAHKEAPRAHAPALTHGSLIATCYHALVELGVNPSAVCLLYP